MNQEIRTEKDALGSMAVPREALYGIHAVRARENFPLARRPMHPELTRAFGRVKQACIRVNRALGYWEGNDAKASALEQAATELADGKLIEHVIVDALQGGAGTSANMNVNEVIANRACILMGSAPGRYDVVSPFDDVNAHQSTNDTYPTALRLAAITGLRRLEGTVLALQEALQQKEKEFAHIVKVGRTELQDAVLITLGREAGAWAEAFNRDRWRIYKCEERLRVVNLGGTAAGTGMGAPREFIFRAAEELRALTGIGFARAENLMDATQNADVFVEVSGILKACAVSLIKVSTDLRLLSSGPAAGLGELILPACQAGSSIMPGKVNPVIPEAVTQAAMKVIGNDVAIGMAAAAGNLELPQFLPLMADALLENLDLLTGACYILCNRCIAGLAVNEEQCRRHLLASPAAATALVARLGYETVADIAALARSRGCTVREIVTEKLYLTAAEFDELTGPEAVCRLGTPGVVKKKNEAG